MFLAVRHTGTYEDTMKLHTIFDWNFQVHHVNERGDIIETLALANNSSVAIAAFEVALSSRNTGMIELRNRMRVMRSAPACSPSS